MERYVQYVLFKVWTKIRNRAQVTPKLDYSICEYYIFQRWVQCSCCFYPPSSKYPPEKKIPGFLQQKIKCATLFPPPQLLEYMNFLFATLLGSIKR